MLLFKLALKNLLGAGTRTWLNVAVTSFSFVLIIFMSGFYQGFLEYAQQVTLETQVAGGAYWHPAYDPDDPFTLDEAHGTPPGPVSDQLAAGDAMPILLTQGSIYPEGRMMPVLIKGIPPNQNIVTLPTSVLGEYIGSAIPVLIGAGMANSAQLEEGDVFTVRWRDAHGTYDADEAEVISIMRVENPGVDMGQLWLPLEKLQDMLEMPGEATYVVRVASEACSLLHAGISGCHRNEVVQRQGDVCRSIGHGRYGYFQFPGAVHLPPPQGNWHPHGPGHGPQPCGGFIYR
jgi:ABC-type lipoprotein release transport system permease subunit